MFTIHVERLLKKGAIVESWVTSVLSHLCYFILNLFIQFYVLHLHIFFIF